MAFHLHVRDDVYYWFPGDLQWVNPNLTNFIKKVYPHRELCVFRTLDAHILIEPSNNGIRNLARAWMKDVELKDPEDTVYVFYDGEEGFSKGFVELAERLSEHLGNGKAYYVLVSGAIPSEYSRHCYNRIQTKNLPLIYYNSWESTCISHMDSLIDVNKKVPKTKDFICFNRHPRLPRILFLGLLKYYNLTHKGHITFNADGSSDESFKIQGLPPAELEHMTRESTYFQDVLPDITAKAIKGWKKNPTPRMRIHHVDDEEFWQEGEKQDLAHTMNLGEWEKFAYDDAHYAIIPETAYLQCWDENLDGVSMPSHFLTEKTWRHVGLKMPLIVIGRPGTLSAMRDLGYLTYHPFIDEEYDKIQDDQERLEAILAEIKRMSKFTDKQWEEWHKGVDKIAEYNYNIMKSRGMEFVWHTDPADYEWN